MKKWVPNDSPTDFVALSGYITAQAITYALQQCGGDLTRGNLIKQATSLKDLRFKMYLPGITLNNSPENYAAYSVLRLARFEGTSWKLLDDMIATGQSKTAH
jgi:hypothetical protein